MHSRHKALRILHDFKERKSDLEFLEKSLIKSQEKMDEIIHEQTLLERVTRIIQQCRPLLSKTSIVQCLALANSAISTIFGFDAILEYDVESNAFIMNWGDYQTDLTESEGGGLVAVISFIFSVYLIVKLEKRRFLVFDEQFTQISDEYIYNFIDFVRQLAKDLGVEILFISHDARITNDMADSVFWVQNGTAKRIK